MCGEDLFALSKVIRKPDGSKFDDVYARCWINWCKSSYEKEGFGHYAVIGKHSDELIGSAGISMQPIDGAWRPEIGYHLREDHRRQGLGKEVAVALRDHFFMNYGDDVVYSYMDADNVSSYKTAESMGMTYLRDFVTKDGQRCRIYSITREEWMRINKAK